MRETDFFGSTGSVGQLLPNMECRLVDDEEKDVGVGQPGEIIIRGPNVCLGYWKNDAATKECLDKDGWLKTGDVAIIDKDHRFWIVDRKKVGAKVTTRRVQLTNDSGTYQSERFTSSTSRA
jgi:4-coumarate--CoA ligase